jgi:DNA-binding NarL/FixJ family response regulator
MRKKKTEQGDEPGEKAGLQGRAKGFAARGQAPRGQAPYRGSSDDLHRRDPADTPITSVRSEKGKEPIQEEEDGRASSLPSSPPPARVLLTDDHPLFRDALRQMLDEASDLEVVGEAGDGQRTLELCRSLKPDLVLMDVRMPKMDGLEDTRAIKREFPHIIVLILTAFDGTDFLLEAFGAGADGYVLKDLTREQLINAIRRVLGGETPLNQELAAELIVGLGGEAEQERGSPPQSEKRQELPLPELLTDRELDVLRLVAQGRHNSEIGQDLGIATGTIKVHMHHINSKLGISDRTKAVVRAIDLGLLAPESG